MVSITTGVHSDREELVVMREALGDPTHFQIIAMLAKCQTCITNGIVLRTPLAQTTISKHLKEKFLKKLFE